LTKQPAAVVETGDQPEHPSGPAHVATVSFLASRASPSAGFWIALAGGVALARTAQRRGARWGYGAALAAMLETVALMGPARFAVPLTQALTAPLLGVLEAREVSLLVQVATCALIRLVQNAAFVAFFGLVLAGGLDAYTNSYDSIAGRLSLPQGTEAALIATGASLLTWAILGSTVQVLVYRRGLRRWPARLSVRAGEAADEPSPASRRRFDPRAVVVAAAIAFVLLLSSTDWILLGTMAGWLGLAWVSARGDRDVIPPGFVIALALAIGVFVFAAIGGSGLELALRRGTRALLLVLVATWLRAAAGSEGLREVFRRALGRLRRVPSVPEATVLLDQLGSVRQLVRSARSVVGAIRFVPKRPIPFLDAILDWVVAESARFAPTARASAATLSLRAVDTALVLFAAAPVVVLLAG